MCDTCGCSSPGADHDHGHAHSHGGVEHTHGTIELGVNVLEKNDALARANRALFDERGVYVVNMISSPGSGKTTIVEAMARHFGGAMVVIEGDVQTRRDAERVIRAGSRAYQIETNGACHLDAHSVAHALEHLDLEGCSLVVIENVGNLVCPATYELGEHEKMAILSLPEGDDKILKYPALFHRIGALLINKVDLAPYLDFDIDKAVNECKSLNRAFTTFPVSGKTGEGIEELCAYLRGRVEGLRS